jgi:hypothetical protein
MKKLFLVLFFLAFASTAFGADVWSEDFDGYSSNYTCNNSTSCALFGTYDDVNGDSSTADTPDMVISTDFERSNPGGNNRGMRIYVWGGTSGTCCENGPAEYNAGIPANFYLRWYMRMSRAGGGQQYAKIFRLHNNRLILDWYRAAWTGNKTRLSLFDYSSSWGNHDPNTAYALEDDYTPNTWVCFEVFIDQTNNQWTLWVDGVQKGPPVPWSNPTNWSTGQIQIGGNQTGPYDYTIDYDDIVIGTTYIGPEDEGQVITPPPPVYGIGFRNVSFGHNE